MKGYPFEITAVVGPTASGKTRRAVALAKEFGGEIISADSRQVYRRMDIGTGKDLEDYGEVPFHLIDVCEAGEKYNLHRYLRDFNTAKEAIEGRGCHPIVCGGTGMYVENALKGLRLPDVPVNPSLREELERKDLTELASILSKMKKLHNQTDVDTVKRAVRAIEIEQYYLDHPESGTAATIAGSTPLRALVVGVDIPREKRRERITERLHARLEQGMVDEVRQLLESGIEPDDLIYYGLEYKYLTLHVLGKLSLEEMTFQLETAIHQFAKRQMTWFRGMEKRGHHIHWLPYDMGEREFIDSVLAVAKKNPDF